MHLQVCDVTCWPLILTCPAGVTITAFVCLPGDPGLPAEGFSSWYPCFTLFVTFPHTQCGQLFVTVTLLLTPQSCTAALKQDIRLLLLFFSIGFHCTLFPLHSMDPHGETEEINKTKNHTLMELHTHTHTHKDLFWQKPLKLRGFPFSCCKCADCSKLKESCRNHLISDQ